jgi:hypothetical protein
MAEEMDFDPHAFIFSYPVWVVSRKDNPESLAGGPMPGGGKFVAVFTDEDLAERFIRQTCRESESATGAIADADAFSGFLRVMQSAGYTHVVLDPSGKPAQVKTLDIDSLLKAVERGGR